MASQQPSRPPTRRPPLGEATRRVNNSQQAHHMPHHDSLKVDGLLQVHKKASPSPLPQGESYQRGGSPVKSRLSAISKEYPGTDSNRNSQVSTVSTNASDGKRIKQTIGPWKLGKTLGKGATARVRLARHQYTGQQAAIKIVQKKNAQMSQAGSLAALDKADFEDSETEDSERRMPVGIEREVAIMKLIQHPNIMKLYDIWENRTEIYLVLEFVDNGELFEHITAKGRLSEEEAIRYFRQILSAVGYCHSFNICHRDLKPENILLTKSGEIKIADFGMAALHQSPDHKLQTSCGSPHYAAPELIKGSAYRGDKVDIWSMGVILYATLAGRLPFDVEGTGRDWLGPLLAKIRKGHFDMASEFSEEASSLIWRILQVKPKDRINLDQIWKHPLIRKYDHLDELGIGNQPQSPTAGDCGSPILRHSDVDKELLRHMRSMWHRFTEEQLINALLTESPNEQKLFYTLLLKYRKEQLENYIPDLVSSSSDYHHTRPLAMTKTYSTRNFFQVNASGHGRQTSRFTVISNAAETERSYDPFKASNPQHLDSMRTTEGAKVTIHRDSASNVALKMRVPSKVSVGSAGDRGRRARRRMHASQSSMASSSRSRGSAPYTRTALVGRKRGISFQRLRRLSGESQVNISPDIPGMHDAGEPEQHIRDEVKGDGDLPLSPNLTSASARYIHSRKGQMVASQPLFPVTSKRGSQMWKEDVRQLSTSLANDCDEAFNRNSVIPGSRGKAVADSAAGQKLERASLETRPLPPPPSRTDSMRQQLLEYKKQAELRKLSGHDSPGHLDRMVSHIDRLIQPLSPLQGYSDRRAISAPLETKYRGPSRPLPSIHEARGEELSPRKSSDPKKVGSSSRPVEAKSSRIASAPEPRTMTKKHADDRFSKPGNQVRDTIRVVQPSSPGSPVKPPAPLAIRKKGSRGGAIPMMSGGLNADAGGRSNNRSSGNELREQYITAGRLEKPTALEQIDEAHSNDYHDTHEYDSGASAILRKKSGWFRRSSKSGDELKYSDGGSESLPSRLSSREAPEDYLDPVSTKSRGFSLRRLFKKQKSKPDMVVTPYDVFDDAASSAVSMAEAQRQLHAGRAANHDDPRARQIAPQQTWLAKIFHVKPVSKYICFSVNRRRARQEITTVLREWRRYGIRDVEVDKERNIVFGKVAVKNFLEMKEVAFAGEVMTVIEHGKRSHLSIARFTQERGAASSFQKVVETLESVLKCRGMLLADERKKRMMIKTLVSST